MGVNTNTNPNELLNTMVNGMVTLMLVGFCTNQLAHSAGLYGEERAELVKKYGSWAVGRAEAICPWEDLGCIEREARTLLASMRMGRPV